MYAFIVTIHIVACLALILIVLLQTGRGAEMGAAFGGASQTLFGGTGSSGFLGKLTTAAAIIFMFTCLGLTLSTRGTHVKSIMENVPIEKPQGAVLPDAKPVEPLADQTGSNAAASKPVEAVPGSEKAAPPPSSPAEATPKKAPGGTAKK
ncbi:MAG: preprotein translocase subunit SecG [Syntrophobacteraceae bacterium]